MRGLGMDVDDNSYFSPRARVKLEMFSSLFTNIREVVVPENLQW